MACAIGKRSFNEETKGQAFNLGNPEPITMKQLAQRIFANAQARHLIKQDRRLEFTYRPIYDDDVRLRIPSIEKAQRILGWNPNVKLDEALERCIDAAIGELKGSN